MYLCVRLSCVNVEFLAVSTMHRDLCLMTKFCLQAIANPQSAECQEKAWQAIVPIVLQLKRYYEFSVALGWFLLAVVSLFILSVY